jgi:hypothetical protein
MQLTGHEIKELLDFVNPEAEADPEQLDASVTLIEREAFVSTDDEQFAAGVYAIWNEYPEEGLYGPLHSKPKKITGDTAVKLAKYAAIKWQSPDKVPDVELGGEKEFWIAAKSIRDGIASEHTFLANYLNKPKVLDGNGEVTEECESWLLSNDYESEISAVGWFSSKNHPDYSNWYEPIIFNESYVLLGWAEYNAPPFFSTGV